MLTLESAAEEAVQQSKEPVKVAKMGGMIKSGSMPTIPKIALGKLKLGAMDPKKEAMREAVFADSFNYNLKPRFGLFSAPFPNTSGDTNQTTAASSRRDASGEVITAPRKMYGGPLR